MNVLLQSKDICKYFGGVKAVNNVDMEIRKGEIFGIIGPNGAGKTTFFNVCSGNLLPTHGEVWFKGEKISGLSSEEIANKGIARTFQNIKLFNFMTVLDNVKIGFHMHQKTTVADAILRTKQFRTDEEQATKRSLEIIEQVGLGEFADTLAGNLSYGVQRKVEIARALATDPEIILLDEPAAGMNPIETHQLMEFCKKVNAEGYTVVVIEHDMKFVMNLCHRILVLNFGTKISEGTPEVIKNDLAVHEAYFGKKSTLGFA